MAGVEEKFQKVMELWGWEVMEEEDYEFLNVINKGSYGVVYIALDKKKGEIVAVKEHVQRLGIKTQKEVDIHLFLPRHPCIVQFKRAAIKIEGGLKTFVVMEHLESDLKTGLEGTKRSLCELAIKRIMGRILEGFNFLHRHGIIHRDIKPANILTDLKFDYKICDFGISERVGEGGEGGTPAYMAPEVIAGSSKQTCAVDLWSVGCIMVALVLKELMFPKIHVTTAEQLSYIRESLVHLPERMATAARNSGKPMLSPSGFDLLRRLLAYRPENRITAHDALHHAWFTE